MWTGRLRSKVAKSAYIMKGSTQQVFVWISSPDFLNCWERKVPNTWPSDVRAGQWCAGDDFFFFFESPWNSIDVLQNRVLSVFEFHGDIQNGLIRAAYIITSIHKCSPCVSKCINYSLKDNCRTSILIFEKNLGKSFN